MTPLGAELPQDREARPRASARHETDERAARPYQYDIAFAGAGLAAVSLAIRLAALPDPPKIILIDPRTEFPRDRTWCHWQLHETPFDDAITHRWHRWTVRTPTVGTVAAATARTPYIRIPADRLHQIAAEKLTTSPHVTILRGVSVHAIDHHPEHTALHLSDGQHITAAWTFDSRPPKNDKAPWHQIFRGLELHSPEANLDTTTVTLMDFQSADSGGIRFFYVLPLDPQTALVEDTWLVPTGQAPAFSNDEILSYARKNLSPTNWQVCHQEEGNLPMGLLRARGHGQPARHDQTPTSSSAPSEVKIKNRIIPWGTAAGAIRPSSGYAFSRIQRASETMTQYWSQHRSPDPAITHESKLLAWMDRVFLRAMTRHPERVPAYFTRLFDRVPTDALIRFLESEPRPADILQVMRALPPAPFLAAALR
jgi:lycopene beta-cyclase